MTCNVSFKGKRSSALYLEPRQPKSRSQVARKILATVHQGKSISNYQQCDSKKIKNAADLDFSICIWHLAAPQTDSGTGKTAADRRQ